MPAQIITTDDLQEFKSDLMEGIKKLLKASSGVESKKYLKSADLKKMLKVSTGTLQTLRINGTLPYSKIGGVIIYDAEEIDKVIKENRIHYTY